ncbi:peptide synthetase [Gordonia sp. X0973]|uniref:peptide synthetase n=1 Tax=Gordonia sp. X0973 TaxID=2742602 RepID=UPI000F535CEC|nr:peptide synthetase [Gordonia sp. X0973]QKT05901.1 peptide synthetase [Gordonia sp. X0973]
MTDTLEARRELLRRRRARRLGTSDTSQSLPVGTPEASSGQSLGAAERRMWRIHQLDPESVSHNITLLLRGDGRSAQQLIVGIESTIAGAAVLSSTIAVVDDEPRREPATTTGRWIEPGGLWALGGGTVGEGIGAQATASALARTPFDLTREAPVRARVFGSDDGPVEVVLSFHHLAVDDTSWPLLLGSMLRGGLDADSRLARSRYVDSASASPTLDHRPTRSTDAEPVDYRLTRSTDAEPVDRLPLAVEHARETWAAPGIRFPLSDELPSTTPEQSWLVPLDEAPGQQLRRDLDPGDLAAFAAYAPTIGGTANAALIALTALTVSALTGAYDHVLLVPADNRRPEQAPDLVGYCGNIIPIRFTFDPDGTVDDAMRAGLASIYAAMTYADVDFGSVLTALRRSGGRFPVVEIMGSVRNAPMRGIPVPDGVTVDYRSVSCGIAPYPMTLAIELADDGSAHLEVDCQLGTGEVIAERAVAAVTDLLHQIPPAAHEPLAALLANAGIAPASPQQ